MIDAMKHTVRSDFWHPELEWGGSDKLIFHYCAPPRKPGEADAPYVSRYPTGIGWKTIKGYIEFILSLYAMV